MRCATICAIAGIRSDGPDVSEVEVVAFAAEAPAGREPKLDAEEHDSFGWFQFEEAQALLDWPIEADALQGRRTALQTLVERLQGGRSNRETD